MAIIEFCAVFGSGAITIVAYARARRQALAARRNTAVKHTTLTAEAKISQLTHQSMRQMRDAVRDEQRSHFRREGHQ